jgi:multiple sugar transport system substrate-binding protein
MRVGAIALAAMLVLAPLGVRAADLVIWWEKGSYPEEDEAVTEIVAAFEAKTAKDVELVLGPQEELVSALVAALEAGRGAPDFIFTVVDTQLYERWAYEGRLVDLTDTIEPVAAQFEPDVLDSVRVLDGTTGRRGLYMLPMGLGSHHVHVWKNLLERAGFTLADIPKEWEPFWSFWCDQVQPAVREALGREDIWGVGVSMGANSVDTANGFWQFVSAYEAHYVTRDGRLVIDDPEVRRRLIKAVDRYVVIYRKGCTPPSSLTWDAYDNNKQFLAQTIVMTFNATLSIVNALKRERPEDYYENAASSEWPKGAEGQPPLIETFVARAAVLKAGGHEETAKEFVRFLVSEGWLGHWLNFAGERLLPPMPALLQSPFWLDARDRHRMTAAMQVLTQPRSYRYEVVSGDWRHGEAYSGYDVWPRAVHRVLAEDISPEQAVDEAIARLKQILSE